MLKLFEEILREVDNKLPSTRSSDVPSLFRDIPLDVFSELLLHVPDQFPNIRSALPSMASEESQKLWTGGSGLELQKVSVAFIRSMFSGFAAVSGKEPEKCTVLDFGCGWGRLTRLLYKFVPVEGIYGVDPLDRSIEECEEHNVKGNICLSDWVPKTLPVDNKFDLIFAFSVFSHLSEKTTRIALETLHDYILPDGVLVITIRPREYWKYYKDKDIAREMEALHDDRGFAFAPHNLAPIDGDITYGDTSMSLEYVKREFSNWTIARIDYNRIDPLQVVLFLTPDKRH